MDTQLTTSRHNWVKSALGNRIVQIGLATWIAFSFAIPFLAHGTIPFNQPALNHLTYGTRVADWIVGPFYAFIFIAVTYALTRHRAVDIAEGTPERAVALRETVGLLIYGAAVLVAAQFVARLIGVHRIGLHLTGSMFGLTETVVPREVYAWTIYNFVFYAALPYWFFRHRGYSQQDLCLKSKDVVNDTVVILFVLAIGLVDALPGSALWRLSAHQLGVGAGLAFVFSLFGTGIPIMIFLTSILVPRYYKLTGSTAATCVLGGFTYASLHLAEYWTQYDTPAHGALSVIFIVLLFGGPGMVKAYLTMRTGNAWVHLWGYHVIWPHVTGDTPIFVKVFGIGN
jgi:hypothetical protein